MKNDKELFSQITDKWFGFSKFNEDEYTNDNGFHSKKWEKFIQSLSFSDILCYSRYAMKMFKYDDHASEWFKPLMNEMLTRDVPDEYKLEVLLIFGDYDD